MDIGMNLPVMAPGLDRELTLAWCRAIDEGPWSSLALGERINFPNPDMIALVSAAAVATERVRLVTNVAVPHLHHPVMLAKQLATVDVLSGGRLAVGLGVGGREEDYLAVDADWDQPRVARLEQHANRLREIWSGTRAHPEALRPVEPFPVQAGGPPLLAGALGPRSIARAARWADGLVGFSFGLAEAEVRAAFDLTRQAWADAGRDAPPRLVTGCFVALGPDADEQMETFLRRYLNFLGPAAEHAIPVATVRSPEALRQAVATAETLGADEVLLTPTTVDPAEVERATSALF